MTEHTYLAIDLKSFYASAECVARGLDPLTANLVVADVSRTDKTICLAVAPSLKAYGIPGRARLFEVKETLARVNEERRLRAPARRFVGESYDAVELARDPRLKIGYLAAKPRMSYYLNVSAQIYGIYLRYASAEDIHVYSIDEVFIDVTNYRRLYHATPHELARRIVQEIIDETGITATAGIGSNMYLAKVAMDIVAKHMPADHDGVRVAELDEMSYRHLLWGHQPLTDFWRVGRGYARRLQSVGLLTMGDVARCSLGRANDYYNEDLLYRMFGVNAELLIDHAWGCEPCTIADVKAYRPSGHSLSNGQVLHKPYSIASARLVVREMADTLSLELVSKGLVARQIGLYIGYEGVDGFEGSMPVSTNRFGKKVPRPANGSQDLGEYTSSTKVITEAMAALYDRIVNPGLMVRRLNIVVADLRSYADSTTMSIEPVGRAEQLDLFGDTETQDRHREETFADRRREHDVQQALLAVKQKFGKNAVLKAMNLEADATGRDRNNQIGGHAAGDAEKHERGVRNRNEENTQQPKKHDSLSGVETVNVKQQSNALEAAVVHPAAVALNATHRYDDIIDMPAHRSAVHPHMSQANRAAQFMPFAALAGYDEVIERTAQHNASVIAQADQAGDNDFGA